MEDQRLNPVAKYAKQFNKCQPFKDRKRASKKIRGKKHKKRSD